MATRLPDPAFRLVTPYRLTVDAGIWTNGTESGELQAEFSPRLFEILLNQMIGKAPPPDTYRWEQTWNIGDPPFKLVFNLS